MNGRFAMFGMNIFFLIGLLVVAVVGAVLCVALWTGVNLAVWQAQRKTAERNERRRKFGIDGSPRPPATRGLCTACGRADEMVYHLPSGERLCPACYERQEV